MKGTALASHWNAALYPFTDRLAFSGKAVTAALQLAAAATHFSAAPGK